MNLSLFTHPLFLLSSSLTIPPFLPAPPLSSPSLSPPFLLPPSLSSFLPSSCCCLNTSLLPFFLRAARGVHYLLWYADCLCQWQLWQKRVWEEEHRWRSGRWLTAFCYTWLLFSAFPSASSSIFHVQNFTFHSQFYTLLSSSLFPSPLFSILPPHAFTPVFYHSSAHIGFSMSVFHVNLLFSF